MRKALLRCAAGIARRFRAFPGRWRLLSLLRRHRDVVKQLPPWRFEAAPRLFIGISPSTNFEFFIDGWSGIEANLQTLRFLRPGDVVLDIGANVGITALRYANAVKPSGRVEAFEASPPIARELAQNVAKY